MTEYALRSPDDQGLVTPSAERYLAVRTVREVGAAIGRADLRRDYERWAREQGGEPESAHALGAAVRQYVGGDATTSVWTPEGPRRAWRGLRLVDELAPDAPDVDALLSRRLDAVDDGPPVRVTAVGGIGVGLLLGTCELAQLGDVPADLRGRYGHHAARWLRWGRPQLRALRRALEAVDERTEPPSVRIRRVPVAARVVHAALARWELMGVAVDERLVDEPARRDIGGWTLERLLRDRRLELLRVEVLDVDAGRWIAAGEGR